MVRVAGSTSLPSSVSPGTSVPIFVVYGWHEDAALRRAYRSGLDGIFDGRGQCRIGLEDTNPPWHGASRSRGLCISLVGAPRPSRRPTIWPDGARIRQYHPRIVPARPPPSTAKARQKESAISGASAVRKTKALTHHGRPMHIDQRVAAVHGMLQASPSRSVCEPLGCREDTVQISTSSGARRPSASIASGLVTGTTRGVPIRSDSAVCSRAVERPGAHGPSSP
jgi:hypothetical protein